MGRRLEDTLDARGPREQEAVVPLKLVTLRTLVLMFPLRSYTKREGETRITVETVINDDTTVWVPRFWLYQNRRRLPV